MKRKKAAIAGGLILLLVILLAVPWKTEIHRTIPCADIYTQEQVNVVVDGAYYAYLLRDDHFVGTIEVVGRRQCTRDYVWRKDARSHFVDDYGQPMGTIIQYDRFSSLSIAEGDYAISSLPDGG